VKIARSALPQWAARFRVTHLSSALKITAE